MTRKNATMSNVWHWMQGVEPSMMKRPLKGLYFDMPAAGAVIAAMYGRATGEDVKGLTQSELIQLGAVAIGKVEDYIKANWNKFQRAYYSVFRFYF